MNLIPLQYVKNTIVSTTARFTMSILVIGLLQNLCNAQNDRLDLNILEHFVEGYINDYLEPGLHTSLTLTIVKEDEFVFSRGYGKLWRQHKGYTTKYILNRIGFKTFYLYGNFTAFG